MKSRSTHSHKFTTNGILRCSFRYTHPTSRTQHTLTAQFPKPDQEPNIHLAIPPLYIRSLTNKHSIRNNTMHHIKRTLAEQTSKLSSRSTGENIRGGISTVKEKLSKMSSPKDTEIRRKLNAWFPNTENPVIFSAPMAGYSNGILAAEVSKAGGFGKFLFPPLNFLQFDWLV